MIDGDYLRTKCTQQIKSFDDVSVFMTMGDYEIVRCRIIHD